MPPVLELLKVVQVQGGGNSTQNGEPEPIIVMKSLGSSGDYTAMILAVLKYDVAPKIGAMPFDNEFQTGDIEMSRDTIVSLGVPESFIGFKLSSMDVRIDKISNDKFHILCRGDSREHDKDGQSRFFTEVSTNQDTIVSRTYYSFLSHEDEEFKHYSHTEKIASGFEMNGFGDDSEISSYGGVRSYTKMTGEDGTVLFYNQGSSTSSSKCNFHIFNGKNAIEITDFTGETVAKIADSDGKVKLAPTTEETQLLNQYKAEFTTRNKQGVDFFAIKEIPTDFDSKFDDPIFK